MAHHTGGRATETLTPGPGLGSGMSDPAVDPEEVRHVAGLARVDLDDEEVERYAEQFAEVLGYFETLEEVPDVEADPELVNVLRPDEVRASLSREDALANAAETEAGRFRGPDVS